MYDVNRPYERAHRNGTARAYSARHRRALVNSETETGGPTHGDHDPGASVYCVHSLTHPTALTGTHVGERDCVGGMLARPCSGADLRQPGIPRRARGPI